MPIGSQVQTMSRLVRQVTPNAGLLLGPKYAILLWAVSDVCGPYCCHNVGDADSFTGGAATEERHEYGSGGVDSRLVQPRSIDSGWAVRLLVVLWDQASLD